MRALIEFVYRSVRQSTPVPILYRENLPPGSYLASFDQLRDRGADQVAASGAQADVVDRTTSELQNLSHKALY